MNASIHVNVDESRRRSQSESVEFSSNTISGSNKIRNSWPN